MTPTNPTGAVLPPRRTALLLAVSGVLAAGGQAPVSIPWLTLAACGVLLWILSRTVTAKQGFWRSWFFGTGYFAAALFWIVEPFLVDPLRHGWMAPFALLFLSGGLALFWAVAGALCVHLTPVAGARRLLAAAMLLTLAELTRSYILTGFPWALIGHVWIGWAPMQLAAWVGPVGLTLLTLLAPALILMVWHRGWSRRALALAPFAGLYLTGYAILAAAPVPETDDRPLVRIIQPNAAQHLKWDRDWAPRFFDRQLELTAAPGEPDLVVWPETAVPYLLNRAGRALELVAEASRGAPVLLGIQRLEGAEAYNSLVALDSAGGVTALYDKHHLVPFGEYLPFGDLLARFGISAFSARTGFGYSAGPGAQLLDLGRFGTALPLICYELIFPQDLFAAPERPDWLLQVTNDAWFGQISGPYQHLAQARLRAVEQRLPMVRAANTGVSAMIDPWGRVLGQLPLGTHGALDLHLPPPGPETLYSRTGDLPAVLLLILAGAALLRPPSRHTG